ncbi:MAG: response regulator [Elusimicrobiota bacterium]|jgi:two-component system phosphate regulon response regulator PhoB
MASILVIDDETELQSLVAYTLGQAGHTVSAASSGGAALAQLGVEPHDASKPLPDLIILDIMMPGMDGYTLSTRLLADDRTRNIPIIILTAKARMKELFAAAPHVAGHMEKPFDPKVLRETVASALKRRR